MTTPQWKKAIRDGTPPARWAYTTARRLGAIGRDWKRYRAVPPAAALPLEIPRDRGFLVVPPATFPEVPAVVSQAEAALANFDAQGRVASKKRFLVNVLPESAHTLDSSIVQLALRPDVIGVVSRYLGMVPLLTAVRVFHSDTTEGVPTSSQLYHLDADDVTQMKIFIYCSDVDSRSGPLTIVDAAGTSRVHRRLRFKVGGRLSDADVEGGQDGVVGHPVLGPAGTVVFVDTSRCLHLGSRVASDAPSRLVVMLQYSTPYSFMVPGRYHEAAPLRSLLASGLSPVQRMVLGD